MFENLPLLPIWLLGMPLVLGVVELVRMPRPPYRSPTINPSPQL